MTNQMNLKRVSILLAGLLPIGLFAQPQIQPQHAPVGAPPMRMNAMPGGPMATPPPMPEKSKLSVAIGMYFGRSITNSVKRGELDIDNALMLKTIEDVINGKPAPMTEMEVQATLNQLKAAMQPRMAARQAAERQKAEQEGEQAKAKGDAFLVQFAKDPTVKKTAEGMEYKVLKEGAGPMPTANDTVTVNYRGTLIDGTEFDHNNGFTHSLRGGLITGWQKIMPLMKVGSKWEVAIPPALAYGPRGFPPKIAPNSVLIFDLELTGITPGAPVPTPPAPPGKPTAQASSANVVSGEIIKVPSADELKKGAKIEVIKPGQTNVVNGQ
jgi:FKBP-type peptidyl-prolyl cis-trans isomerase